MKVLVLELSSGQGSIAFRDGEDVRFSRQFANDRKHSGLFFESLRDSFAQFGPAERIVVGLGPGSYAGTRIALATAIGLQAATGAELFGLASFLTLPTNEMEYAVTGDARRQSFWFAQVRARRCIAGPQLCSAEELQTLIAAAKGPVFSAEVLPGAAQLYPSAAVAATQTESLVRPPLEPIYLREPHITRPKAA